MALCYHSINRHLPFAVAPDAFRAQIEWLHENCTIVPFDRILAKAAEGDQHAIGRPIVAVTFDDGYADNFDDAYPVLAATSTPATFFVTVGFVDRDTAVLARMEAQRRREGIVSAMTWDQVRELHAAGFAIGSHTYSHAKLAKLPAREASDEISRAKTVLEERLEAPARLFSYPWGRPGRHFTRETVELVRRAGHTDAAAVFFRAVRPSDDRLAIPRFFVSDGDLATLEAKVRGAWDAVGAVQERLAPAYTALR